VVTSGPKLAFRPDESAAKSKKPHLLRYRYIYAQKIVVNSRSVLPREAVCTENLTPWLKLLPCRSKAGIAALLSPFKLYDVHFHSLGVHLRHTSNHELELIQTLTVLFDPKLSSSKEKGKHCVVWTDKCCRMELSIHFWESKVAKSINGANFLSISACPIARDSRVYVQLNEATVVHQLELLPLPSTVQDELAVYELKKISSLSLSATVKSVSLGMTVLFNLVSCSKGTVKPPQLLAQRYFTGKVLSALILKKYRVWARIWRNCCSFNQQWRQ
jgi:hypothetical protein